MTSILAVTVVALCPDARAQALKHYSGKQVYQAFCIVCHGMDGKGSPVGANLTAHKVKSKSDEQIVESIAKGVPNTGMSAYESGLSENEITRVMLYIRELQGDPRDQTHGDEGTTTGLESGVTSEEVRRGQALFAGKAGCIRCHSLSSKGGSVGPDLSNIGGRLSPDELRTAIRRPSKFIAPGFDAKDVRTAGGRSIRARYRNETADAIELLNEDGELWATYFKSDLYSIEDARRSLMPEKLLDKLSEQEQSDLFAFLESLK